MGSWFSARDLTKVARAEHAAFPSPVPTRVVSNGEWMPPPQTPEQLEVETRIKESADALGKRLGQNRREFLRTSLGMAAAFVAMNEVFGPIFAVDRAEAQDPAAAAARAAGLANEFVFDDQTHHVHDTYTWKGVLFLREFAAGKNPEGRAWNPALAARPSTLEEYKFDRYIKDIFLDSDTKIALLSGFTTDTPENMAVSSDQIVQSRDLLNRLAGSRRMLAHGLFWPGYPGYLDEMDRLAQQLRIDSWKGYTVGDPLGPSKYPWRLDDQKLAYPAYEKAMKLGIRNVCIHKGLMPSDYLTSFKNWQYATVEDVGRAAKDWPGLNFIIYHAGLRPFFEVKQPAAEFEQTGRLPWISELAEIPRKHGVSNVYAEIGTAFASTVITYPRLAAGMLGVLINGMGADHVVWGSDSIWYGSPQWQIEALRRLEIPDDMQKKFGFAPLGPATGLVKRAIFGYNSAGLYKLDLNARLGAVPPDFKDKLAVLKAEYEQGGPARSNTYAGWVRTTI